MTTTERHATRRAFLITREINQRITAAGALAYVRRLAAAGALTAAFPTPRSAWQR